jgi:hypothetical protein
MIVSFRPPCKLPPSLRRLQRLQRRLLSVHLQPDAMLSVISEIISTG